MAFLFATVLSAQERMELVPCGDFEHWESSQIKESRLLGGHTKTFYKMGGVWDCSNAHAKALGVEKVSVSVRPEKRGSGYCCRMETTLEVVTAIGIDLKALATGSIFTGKMLGVVGMKHSTDPNSAIDMGVPFTKRPTALVLDYKAVIQDKKAVYANAIKKVKELDVRDEGHITIILQHRWEENGHVYAYRVGTGVKKIDKTTADWVNDYRVPIEYGKPAAIKPYNALCNNRQKTRNSQGKMVCIEEVDWRGDLTPTHMIIQISAGSMKPFMGCPGNVVWCDNIRLAYGEK